VPNPNITIRNFIAVLRRQCANGAQGSLATQSETQLRAHQQAPPHALSGRGEERELEPTPPQLQRFVCMCNAAYLSVEPGVRELPPSRNAACVGLRWGAHVSLSPSLDASSRCSSSAACVGLRWGAHVSLSPSLDASSRCSSSAACAHSSSAPHGHSARPAAAW
jgi:hypothetical protein